MICPKPLRMAHEEVQKKLFLMLPEKWEKLFLYASVIDHFNNLQTGEMFFYYYPKGVLKKRPINVYEVPAKFNIDEKQYFMLADELYQAIKNLREECIKNNEKAWTNVTISMEKLKYRAEFGFEDLNYDESAVNERHAIWAFKYLDTPYESFSKKEKEVIDNYLKNEPETYIFEAPLYTREIGKELEEISDMEKKMTFVTEEKMKEMEYVKTHIPKSQILK